MNFLFVEQMVFRRNYEYAALITALLTVGRMNTVNWLLCAHTLSTHRDPAHPLCTSAACHNSLLVHAHKSRHEHEELISHKGSEQIRENNFDLLNC